MSLLDLHPHAGRAADLVRRADDLARVFAAHADEQDAEPSPAAVDALRASGLTALTVPEALGGIGASLHEFALVQERLGRADASLALIHAMNGHVLGSVGEAGGWPEGLYARAAHGAVRGDLVNALASEPELGSPSRGGLPRTRVERVPGGWRLTGRKTWSTGASVLDTLVVTAADGEDVRRFLVPARAQGVHVERTWRGALALRASGSDDVVFDGVFVPEENLVEPTPPRFPSNSAWFWSAVAATYLGVGSGALEALRTYLRGRVPTALGHPLADLPDVRRRAGQIELDLALAQARAAEDELRAGTDRGPLHGIPVALKDLVDTAGVLTTCGSRVLARHVPQHDAVVTRRLREAGAVLVGKTNLLEFAYGIVHPDFGQTNNPWDLSRTSGGSSGGSVAAVAAGLCFAAVGTDTGGSIRIPASYCGVAGLKPTYGLVPLDGVFPLSWSLDHAGPVARTSSDAALLLAALTGHEVDAAPLDLRGVRLGVLDEHARGPEMQPGVAAVFDAALARLVEAGAEVRHVRIADLDLVDTALMNVLLPEASAVHATWLREFPDAYAGHTRTQLELGFTVSGVAYVRAQQFRRRLAHATLAAMEGLGALLSPTVAWVAPHEDPVVAADEGADEARRTAPANLTGFPALSVQAGFSQGLPVGLQITTRPGEDALALSLGAAVEELLGACRVPPLVTGPSLPRSST